MNPNPMLPDFTIEDMEVLKRCRKESFWRACVPMVIGSTAVVAFAQSRGYFASRPRLRYPAYFLAVVCGYFGGKFSYVGKCKQMFLELDDSRVKDLILGNRSPMQNAMIDSGGHLSSMEPVIVETPVEQFREQKRPTTYEERREFFRQQRIQDPSTPPPEDASEASSGQPAGTNYFDHDRPLSSLLSDDAYVPRE